MHSLGGLKLLLAVSEEVKNTRDQPLLSLQPTLDCDPSSPQTDTPSSLLRAGQPGISAFNFESELEV